MAAIQNVFATRLLAELLGHEVDSGLLKEERPSNNPQTLHVKCAIVLGKEIANFSQKTLDEDIPPRLWKDISAYMCPWTLIKLGEEFLLKKGVNVDECWQVHYNRRWPWKYSRSALDLLDRHNLTHKQLYIDRHFMKFLEEYCRMRHLCLERVLSHDLMWCSVYEYDPKVTCYLPKHVQVSMKTDTMATRVLALAPYVTSLTLNSTLSVFLECHLELVHLLLNSVVLLRVQCHPAITESNCCWNIIETFLKHGKLQEFSLTFAKRNDGFVGFERLMNICAGIHDSEFDIVQDSSFDCDISDCSEDVFDENSEGMVNNLKCKNVYDFDSSIAKKLKLHSEKIYFYNNNDKNNNDSGDNLNNCQRVFNNSNSLFDSIGAVDKNGHTTNCGHSISDVGKMQQVLDQKLRRGKEFNTPAVRNIGCCQMKFRDKEGKNKDTLLTSSEENSLLTSMLWHQNLNSQTSSSSESHCHSNIEASPKSRKCLKSTFSRFDSRNHVITSHSKNMNCLNMSPNPFMMSCCHLKEHSISTDKLCKLCSYRMSSCFQSMTSCPHSIKFETKRKTSYSVLTALLSNSYDELAEVKKLRPADRYRYCKPLGKEFAFCSSTGKDSVLPFGNSWDDNLPVSRSLCEEENISVVKCYQNADDSSQSDKTSKTSNIGSSTESEVPNTESSTSMSSSNITMVNDTSSDQNEFQSFIGKIKDENGISNKSCFKSPPNPREKKRMNPNGDINSRRNSTVDIYSPLTSKQLESRRISFDIYADLDEGIVSEEETTNSKMDPSLSDSKWLSSANCQQSSPISTPGSTKSDNSLWDLCLGLSKKMQHYSSKGLKSLRLIGEPNPHIGDVLRDVLPMWPALQKLYLNVSGLNNPELLDIISDLVNKKQLKDLSIIGCETEDGVFRRVLNCLHKSYRDDGKKEGLNLLNIQSLADPSITCSAILPHAEPLYGVKTMILRDNTFDVFGVTGLLRIITYDNALVKLNLKCCFLHAWMGQLLAAIASKGQMEELYLGSNQIEGTHPELELINVIDSCKNLRKLDLRSCSLRSQVVLSDSFISALRNHKNLEFLCLKANRLGVTVLSLIDKLHDRKEPFSLKILNISGNPFNVERYGVDTILKTYRCQPRVPWLRELKMKSCFQISTREKEKDIHNYVGKWISGYAKHVSFNIEVSSCGLRFVEYADANSVVYM